MCYFFSLFFYIIIKFCLFNCVRLGLHDPDCCPRGPATEKNISPKGYFSEKRMLKFTILVLFQYFGISKMKNSNRTVNKSIIYLYQSY